MFHPSGTQPAQRGEPLRGNPPDGRRRPAPAAGGGRLASFHDQKRNHRHGRPLRRPRRRPAERRRGRRARRLAAGRVGHPGRGERPGARRGGARGPRSRRRRRRAGQQGGRREPGGDRTPAARPGPRRQRAPVAGRGPRRPGGARRGARPPRPLHRSGQRGRRVRRGRRGRQGDGRARPRDPAGAARGRQLRELRAAPRPVGQAQRGVGDAGQGRREGRRAGGLGPHRRARTGVRDGHGAAGVLRALPRPGRGAPHQRSEGARRRHGAGVVRLGPECGRRPVRLRGLRRRPAHREPGARRGPAAQARARSAPAQPLHPAGQPEDRGHRGPARGLGLWGTDDENSGGSVAFERIGR